MWLEGSSGVFSEGRFRDRLRLISLLFAAGYAIILLRLFYLQILRGDDLARISESNRTQVLFLRAPRGDFFDRNGKLLISNRPSWSLMFSVTEENKLKREVAEERLKPLLDPISDKWRGHLRTAYQTKRMVRLVSDVPDRTAFGLSELGELVPGARMEMEFRRGYGQGTVASHLIGYLGEINERELKDEIWTDRKPGDLVGKMGLERVMDKQLRGEDGGTVIEVDSAGRLQRVIKELPYHKGNSLFLTIDRDIQKAAIDGLAASPTRRGAAVMLDSTTGAVLAWVSYPAFSPGSIHEDILDPNLPLFDRVAKGAYPPGSLFKLITAAAGFERNAINTAAKVYCKGFLALKDKEGNEKKYRCWKAHGLVDYWRAVAESCDVYFYQLGETIGAQSIYDTARQFGLGEPVQNIFAGENAGHIPNPVWKRRRGLGGWSTGDTYNMSIGQGFVTSTPLQMATMINAFATEGKMPRPYLVEKIVDESGGVNFQAHPALWRNVMLKESTWNMVREAMKQVVKHGTGQACNIPYLDVRGKTGTAQNPHGDDHAWFGAFAGYPGEAPKVAVLVFVENGGHGGSVAAAIARPMLEIALPPKTSPNPAVPTS